MTRFPLSESSLARLLAKVEDLTSTATSVLHHHVLCPFLDSRMDSDGPDDMLLEAPSTPCSPQHSLAESKQNLWIASEASGWSTALTSPTYPPSPLNMNEASKEDGLSANDDCHVAGSEPQSDAKASHGVIEKRSSLILFGAVKQTVEFTPVVCAVSDARNVHDAPLSTMRTSPDKAEVIRKIELMFENITDTLLANKGKVTIGLRSRAVPPGPGSDHRHAFTTNDSEDRAREICFPGSTPQEAWRFGQTRSPYRDVCRSAANISGSCACAYPGTCARSTVGGCRYH